MPLNREQILRASDLTRNMARVEVPEWADPEDPDPTVCIRVMSGAERARFEEGMKVAPSAIFSRLVAATACDEAGKLLFAEDDIPALNDRSFPALNRVFEAALKLNSIGPAEVEGEAKNS
jgi:hypothetical protein